MKYTIKHYPHLKEQVEKMSTEDLLRAIICPNMFAEQEPIRSTASVFVHPTTSDHANEIAKGINDGRKKRALIVSDMEYGASGAIQGAVAFPSMWAAGEAKDKELAYQMGAIAAKEAINAGYHWTFGPCVDIVGNKYNPIVVLRTAEDNPDTVIEYGGAYMEGLQDNGLIATLKHFPGDGFSPDDQHVTTTENPLSKEEWDNTFGKVYAALIERGAMSIMPGHIALPAYDEIDEATGLYPPASVSKNILTGVLREKLGFDGIIVSDAVNMNGFCGYMNLYHASAAFLEAGGDCLLFMHDTEEYRTEMKACISEGRLSMETLKNRAYRMLCFAEEYFEKHPIGEKVPFDRDEAESVAKAMVEKSVKIVRDRHSLLPFPISKDTRIAHVILYNSWVRDFSVTDELTAKLSEIAGTVEEFRDPGDMNIQNIVKSGKYDLMVCSILESPEYGLNTAKLCGPIARNMMGGWTKFQTPVLFVDYHTPFFGDIYKACADTLINTYGCTQYTVDAVVDLIRGIKG